MKPKFSSYTTFLLIAATVTSCSTQKPSRSDQEAQSSRISSKGVYPKLSVPTTSLQVVDLAHDQIEGQIAACGLQGIINRSSKNKVYVMNTLCRDNHGGWNNAPGENNQSQMGRLWLREIFADLPKEELSINTNQPNPGFMALLQRNKAAVKGLIIYDPALEEATIEAATTIAGQTDGLIVSPQLAQQLQSYSFPLIIDLRGKFKSNIECLDWLKANYFKTANTQVAFTWSHMTTNPQNSWGAANKDYVVANRLFTFFLDIAVKQECAYYDTIIKEYPAGTPIMGWTDELKADKLFADYGYFMVPCISVENLTVLSSYPSVTGKQSTPKAYPIEKDAVYISFYVADGDNLLHSLIYEPYTICNSTNFGTIPTTWILNPAIVDLAPPVYQWYQKKIGNQELGGMMGDGSPVADRFSGFSYYCDYAKHYLDQAGMRTMKQMIDGESISWRVQPYVVNSGYSGAPDWRGVGAYEYHLDNNTFHVGTVNDSQLLSALNSAPKDQPLFLSVFCGTAVKDAPTTIKELASQVTSRKDGKKYYFVRSMDLAATYRQWKGISINQ